MMPTDNEEPPQKVVKIEESKTMDEPRQWLSGDITDDDLPLMDDDTEDLSQMDSAISVGTVTVTPTLSSMTPTLSSMTPSDSLTNNLTSMSATNDNLTTLSAPNDNLLTLSATNDNVGNNLTSLSKDIDSLHTLTSLLDTHDSLTDNITSITAPNDTLTSSLKPVSGVNTSQTITTVNDKLTTLLPKKTFTSNLTSKSTVNDNLKSLLKPLAGNILCVSPLNDKMKATIDELDEFLIRNDRKDDEEVSKNDNDDGNDTDDLLRMLGEDENKGKKRVLTKTRPAEVKSEDEDSFDDDMFEGAKVETIKIHKNAIMKTKMSEDDMQKHKYRSNNSPSRTKPAILSKSIKAAPKPPATKVVQNLTEPEFLEELNINHQPSKSGQVLRRPELMEEEIPSDLESDDDQYSFYDEFPSSDSDDVEEWFELDLRMERGGDYIPLLGENAKQVLEKEKAHVTEKVNSLLRRVESLNSEMRDQARQLDSHRQTLVRLDDLLSHH